MPTGIKMVDNLGNVYKHQGGNCAVDLINFRQEFYLAAGKEVEFRSSGSRCSSTARLPYYGGNIPLEATEIYLIFEDFGPFRVLKVIIKL